MRKVDVIDVVKRLRSISHRARKLSDNEIELGQRVLENRVMVLEGYLNFLDQEAIPSFQKIIKELDEIGEKVYIGGSSHD